LQDLAFFGLPALGAEGRGFESLRSRFGYVSISRASHEATVFTDDMAKLSPQLSADVSKTSALEFNQAPSIAQGIGMM
jgi:hypothetical protein